MKRSTLQYALDILKKQQDHISAVKESERVEQDAYVNGLRTMLDIILTEGYTKAAVLNLYSGIGLLTDEEWNAMNERMRTDFTVAAHNSDDESIPGTERAVTLLFNRDAISEAEVKDLIRSGAYMDDDRVICTTPRQADLFANGALSELNAPKVEKAKLNTKISYLYRDASNYKIQNTAIIDGVLTAEQIEIILSCLDCGEDFIPKLVGLPETRFGSWTEEDHDFFELSKSSFTQTRSPADVGITPDQLVRAFLAHKDTWNHFS